MYRTGDYINFINNENWLLVYNIFYKSITFSFRLFHKYTIRPTKNKLDNEYYYFIYFRWGFGLFSNNFSFHIFPYLIKGINKRHNKVKYKINLVWKGFFMVRPFNLLKIKIKNNYYKLLANYWHKKARQEAIKRYTGCALGDLESYNKYCYYNKKIYKYYVGERFINI